jgi:predicted phosphoribosyltransferase
MRHVRRPYAGRGAAGRELAGQLTEYAGRADVVVLALPRGGVPVALPVAQALRAPLDIVVVRKLGAPGQPELAMGAIAGFAEGVELVRNDRVITALRISAEQFDAAHRAELAELRRREAAYREGRPAISVRHQTVLVVDDGLATGSTMAAAVAAARHQQPDRVVVAVPIGSPETCVALRDLADEVVCLWTPRSFYAVGQGYLDFRATDDDEVRDLLRAAATIGRRRTSR